MKVNIESKKQRSIQAGDLIIAHHKGIAEKKYLLLLENQYDDLYLYYLDCNQVELMDDCELDDVCGCMRDEFNLEIDEVVPKDSLELRRI